MSSHLLHHVMEILPLLPSPSWLEREAVNLKVGSLSLPGGVLCRLICTQALAAYARTYVYL